MSHVVGDNGLSCTSYKLGEFAVNFLGFGPVIEAFNPSPVCMTLTTKCTLCDKQGFFRVSVSKI